MIPRSKKQVESFHKKSIHFYRNHFYGISHIPQIFWRTKKVIVHNSTIHMKICDTTRRICEITKKNCEMMPRIPPRVLMRQALVWQKMMKAMRSLDSFNSYELNSKKKWSSPSDTNNRSTQNVSFTVNTKRMYNIHSPATVSVSSFQYGTY